MVKLWKKTRARFVVVYLSGWFLAAAPSPAQEMSPPVLPQEPDYGEILQREWGAEADWKRFGLQDGWRLDRFKKSDPRRIANRAQEAWEAYELTGDARYARTADQLVNYLARTWQEKPAWIPGWCFFSQEPLLKAAAGLSQADALEADTREQLLKFSRQVARRQLGTDNQALSRQAGVAQAIQLFPESKAVAQWKKYLDDGWAELLALEDFDENATGYNAIGLRAALEIAGQTGREEDLRRPDLRRAFERFRDLQTPSGSWPEYGDHYFGNDLDPHALEAMEKAARLYQDPTFLTAAWKHFWRTGGQSPSLRTRDAKQAANIKWVTELGEAPFAPAPLSAGSLITLRHTPQGRDRWDKMVLSPNRLPGSPYVLLDLYCDGYHAHQNRWGAVLYYEADGIPLFHGLSRHATGAEHANMVILRPVGEAFPLGSSDQEPDTWKTASFPTRDLEPVTGEEGKGRKLSDVTFRLDPRRTKGLEVFVDNIRLEGPAGVRLVEDFEGISRGFPRSEEATSGEHGVLLPVGKTRQKFWRPRPAYEVAFDSTQYTELKFDWKYRAQQDGEFSFIFRVPGIHNGPVRFLNDAPVLKMAEITEARGANYGELWLNDYMSPSTTLRRELLLLDSGPLLIRDTLLPGAAAAGMQGGPIWHLYSLRARGRNWFAGGNSQDVWPYPDQGRTPFAPRELLVVYAPEPDMSFGQVTSKITSFEPSTTFAKAKLEPGRAVQFLTVLLPYDPELNPANLAASIEFFPGVSETMVVLPQGDASQTIIWRQNGTFSLQPSTFNPTLSDSS